jgi:hypothetical protein
MEILLTIFCLAAIFILLIAVVIVRPAQQQATFIAIPPLTDDEFMARLPPGTNRDIALKVRRIVADQFAVEYGQITPETSFVNDLGAD